jgi:hypothetical protein
MPCPAIALNLSPIGKSTLQPDSSSDNPKPTVYLSFGKHLCLARGKYGYHVFPHTHVDSPFGKRGLWDMDVAFWDNQLFQFKFFWLWADLYSGADQKATEAGGCEPAGEYAFVFIGFFRLRHLSNFSGGSF